MVLRGWGLLIPHLADAGAAEAAVLPMTSPDNSVALPNGRSELSP